MNRLLPLYECFISILAKLYNLKRLDRTGDQT